MTKTITVNVTADHIRDGKRNRCTACPIALALMEQHGHRYQWGVAAEGLGVGTESVWLNQRPLGPDTRTLRIPLPAAAIRFVEDFDNGLAVEPFTFTLTWEEETP